MHKPISLILVVSVALLTACNRAVPEKAEGKAGQNEQPAGVLANKQNAPGPSILPPEGTSQPINTSQQVSPPVDSGSTPTASRNGPPPPGIQIEDVAALSPTVDDASSAPLDERLADRSFMKLQLPDAALAPDQLLGFLVECDRAVQELAIAREQLNEKFFLEQAKRLSTMKLVASERLVADPSATAAQKKTSIAAQVESLSQLTGLGDVDAAQKLLKVAGELAQSPDAQLAHQGRLVLMGFNLNQLVEGQIKDPQVIVDGVNGLLDKSDYRGLVELLALQQSMGVLNQLGYAEQAKLIQDRVVREFRNSSDKEVAMRSWMIEVGTSPELKAAFEGIQNTLAGTEPDPTKVATLATNFIKAYPTLNTAAYFLKVIVDLEYGGRVDAARELSKTIANSAKLLPAGPLSADIDNVLDGHARRLGALGKPLTLEQLSGMDGAPFDWNDYRNKVVLVYFWASWEVPSLNLIDQIKKLRGRIPATNFEVVGICVDDGRTITNAEQLVARQGLTWRNLRSSNPSAVGIETAAAKKLGVNAYSNFALLVNKKGEVRAVHPSFDNIDAMINELLKE